MFERDWAMDGVRELAGRIRWGTLAMVAALMALGGCIAEPGEMGELEEAFEVDSAPDLALEPLEIEMTVLPDAEGLTPVFEPPTVAAYRVAATCAPIDLKTMMVEFNTYGTPEELAYHPGLLHVTQRGRHLFYFPDGAGEFVDLRYMQDDAPAIQPMPREALFEAAEEILDELGGLEVGPVTLSRKGIEERHRDAGGSAAGNALLTHQVAVLEQRIDGRKAFGPGARVEVVFPGDDFAAEFSHAIRCLSADQVAVPQRPDDALRSFGHRVERGEFWDLLGAQVENVSSLDVRRVRLGFYIPRIGEPAEVVDPVYEITGTAKGFGSGSEPIIDEFLWYEPAIAGRPLPTTTLQD